MKCKKDYTDKEKYRKYHNRYNNRYYRRTENAVNRGMVWTQQDMEMILKKEFSDRELSIKLGRSVRAIQGKRNRLKAESALEAAT